MTTVAQNIPVFLRKSPLHKKYFFEWLKTAVLLFDCGTVTLKSLLSLRSDAPHVHLRPRKRLARCTLDCGFKTSESPALRGFVGGSQALATAALYLVLLSNGLRLSKNLPAKLVFRPNPFPRISPKSYRHNAVPNRFSSRFSTSRTNAPRLLSLPKAGTHSPFREKSHTRAHTPKQGCFGWGWYHYPRTVLRGSETLRGQGVERQTLPLLGLGRGCSQRTQKAFGTAMRLCASLFRGVAAPLGCVICLQLGDVAVFSLCAQYFLNVRGGGGITTLGAFHTVRKPCVARG